MTKILILESIHQSGVERLKQVGDVEMFVNKPREDVLAKIADADAVVCKSVTRVDREFIDAAPGLKVVGRAGTGTDNFDKPYLAEKNIPLFTIPTGNSISAAEFAVMLILNLVKNSHQARRAVRIGDFRRDLLEGRELGCMTVGIVGFGNVGRNVAKRLAAFGCDIVVYDPREESRAACVELGYRAGGDVADLASQCDLLTLHATLNNSSRGIINTEVLAKAKPGMFLVNTARGAMGVDADIIEALDKGILAGVAIDTLHPEPPYNAKPGTHDFDHPLLHHDKVFVYPHMAASTVDAQERIATELADKMASVLAEG